ncbi:MAG: hypothetical protein KC636_29235 [Myxococcales bacterium]|nr:hypothetical protein [Myxococcales bacterium]
MRLSLPKFQYRFIPSLGHVIHPGNFHPVGVREGIARDLARARGQAQAAPGAAGRWLIVGGSGGFGSAARAVLGARRGAHTLNVSLDALPNLESKNIVRQVGSPGFHRTLALEHALRARGLVARSVQGDGFDPQVRAAALQEVREHLGGPLDGIVWALAAPRAQDPRTGKAVSSALRPMGVPVNALAGAAGVAVGQMLDSTLTTRNALFTGGAMFSMGSVAYTLTHPKVGNE